MADPTPYSRSYSFSGYQTATPSAPLPAQQVDTQLDAIASAVQATITALKDVRRSDGRLQAGLIGVDQFDASFSVGFTLKGVWTSGQSYGAGDGIVYGTSFYKAKNYLASSTVTPDIDTTNWLFLFNLLGPVPTDGSVTNIKLASAPALTLKGNATGSLATPTDLTVAQVAGLLPIVRYDTGQGLSPAQQSQGRANIMASGAPPGQCRLNYVSATSIRLDPYNGNQLFINGVFCTVPAAGVATDNSGLAATTANFIYAWLNSGTMTLEKSATAPAVDATYGHRIKTGDPTRVLVGGVFTNASSQFADSAVHRGVASWFNRRQRPFQGVNSAATTASTALIEVATGYRVLGFAWAEDAISANLSGYTLNNTTNAFNTFYVGFAQYGASITATGAPGLFQSTIVNGSGGAPAGIAVQAPADGGFVLSVMGQVSSGSGTFNMAVVGGVNQ